VAVRNYLRIEKCTMLTFFSVKNVIYIVLHCLDPRVADWLLVRSPLPIIAIFFIYLCLIFMGPKWMRNRAPLQLKPLLFVYNAFQVGLSAYMFYEFLASSYLARYNLTCQPVDFSMDPLALRVINSFSNVIEPTCPNIISLRTVPGGLHENTVVPQ
jgi:elongation of very long chain fatty acids protein 4